jgi:hypothetical protein
VQKQTNILPKSSSASCPTKVQPQKNPAQIYVQPAKMSIGSSIMDGLSSGFGWGIGTSLARGIFGFGSQSQTQTQTETQTETQTQTQVSAPVESDGIHGSKSEQTDSELYSYKTSNNSYSDTSYSGSSYSDNE